MRRTASAGGKSWRALTPEQKQQRLAELRRRQQVQIELEVRRLHVH